MIRRLPTAIPSCHRAVGVNGKRYARLRLLGACAVLLALTAAPHSFAKERSPPIPRFCVAQRDASETDVKNAIRWACTSGGVSGPVCNENACEGDLVTIYDRADIIFNVYYKRFQKAQQDRACVFGGAAQLSTGEPGRFYDFTTNVLTCP
jgi:hypothetical protein